MQSGIAIAASAALGAAGLLDVSARHSSGRNKASLLGDRVWAQQTTYTPPEPIDTSAQAEAKRERKRLKRLRELAKA